MFWAHRLAIGAIFLLATYTCAAATHQPPVHFIDRTNTGNFYLTDAGRGLLDHKWPPYIISVVGRNKRGKSYMLNQLLRLHGTPGALNVSSDPIHPGTHGMWAAGPACLDTADLVPCTPQCRRCALFVDVEGVNSVHGTPQGDRGLMLLALAASDAVLYNIDMKVDLDDLVELSEVLGLASVYLAAIDMPYLAITVQRCTLRDAPHTIEEFTVQIPHSRTVASAVADLARFPGQSIHFIPPAVDKASQWAFLAEYSGKLDTRYTRAVQDLRISLSSAAQSWPPAPDRAALLEGLLAHLKEHPMPTAEGLAVQIQRTVESAIRKDLMTSISSIIPLAPDAFSVAIKPIIDEGIERYSATCQRCPLPDAGGWLADAEAMNVESATRSCFLQADEVAHSISMATRVKSLLELQFRHRDLIPDCWAVPSKPADVEAMLRQKMVDLEAARHPNYWWIALSGVLGVAAIVAAAFKHFFIGFGLMGLALAVTAVPWAPATDIVDWAVVFSQGVVFIFSGVGVTAIQVGVPIITGVAIIVIVAVAFHARHVKALAAEEEAGSSDVSMGAPDHPPPATPTLPAAMPRGGGYSPFTGHGMVVRSSPAPRYMTI